MSQDRDDARVLHRRLSERAVRLLERGWEDPRARRPVSLEELDLPPWISSYPYPLQSWPTFVDPRMLDELRRATLGVTRLVHQIPERIFDGDAEKIAAFYRFDSPMMTMMMLEPPSGLSASMTRLDWVDTPDGLACLEVNSSSYLGGWQHRLFALRLLEHPWLADLAEGAVYRDPLPVLFEHVVQQALVSGVMGQEREINLAFMVSDKTWKDRDPGLVAHFSDTFRRHLDSEHPDLSGELLFLSYAQLGKQGRRLAANGRPLHALVEYHTPGTDPRAYRAFKARQLDLYSGPIGRLLGDKRNLALLSEKADLFDDEDRELIAAHIPWGRVTLPGTTEFHGERVDLERFARSARERLVLKPGVGARGDGVLIGPATPPELWERGLEEAFASGRWILQELVRSLPYRFVDRDGQIRPHEVIWGLFAFGSRYGGGFMRMMPQDEPAVVNSAKGATEGLLLEVS